MNCLDCGGDLSLSASVLDKGTIVICAECGAELEVVRPRPLQLRLVADDEESAATDGPDEPG